MQNKNYRNTFAISQSSIKDWRFKPPVKWKKIWIDNLEDNDRDDDSFSLGSLVDTVLFTPDELDKRFVISEEKLPSKAIESIIKSCYISILNNINHCKELNNQPIPEEIEEKEFELINWKEVVLQCANDYINEKKEKGWNKGWKEDTRVNKIIEEGNEYFQHLKNAAGRKIIDPTTNMEAIKMADVLRKNENVKKYFIEQPNETLIHQLEIFLEYELKDGSKVPLKGAIDILHLDHKNKTIQVVDLKTSFSAFDFIKSIKQYSYTAQLSFYNYLVNWWIDQKCENKEYCEYTFLPPANIVIDPEYNIPYVYEYDWKDINMEADGNSKYLSDLFQTIDHNARIKIGWKDIIEEIGWHLTNNKWDMPKELYENKKIKVNLLNS